MAKALAIETYVPTTLGKPTILNQLNTGACFGFSAVQGIHIARQATGAASEIPSPVIPYWMARREVVATDADITDSGSDPDSMIRALADFGACPMASDPFLEAEVNTRPNDVALLAAQRVKCELSPILATGADLWEAIRHCIQIEQLPVLIALEVVPSFDNAGADGIIDDPSGTSRGGHANCIYGFDDFGALDANSWSLDWAKGGTATLTPRFLAGAVTWAGALRVLP